MKIVGNSPYWNGLIIPQQVFTEVKTEAINYCCISFERQKYKITFWKRRKYHFTLCRKAWNFTKRFNADKFRIIYACVLMKIKIYVYFCNNIVFLKEKTNKSGLLWHRRDRQYASNNERCIIYYKFIFITPPASIQINLKTLSSILWFNSQYLLNSNALKNWWRPGCIQAYSGAAGRVKVIYQIFILTHVHKKWRLFRYY